MNCTNTPSRPASSAPSGNKSAILTVKTIVKTTMSGQLDQFDAPELKTAVKRLYGNERAPTGLRHRVESILQAEQPPAPSLRINPAPIWQWAAAAAIFIGLIGLTLRASYDRTPPIGSPTLPA